MSPDAPAKALARFLTEVKYRRLLDVLRYGKRQPYSAWRHVGATKWNDRQRPHKPALSCLYGPLCEPQGNP